MYSHLLLCALFLLQGCYSANLPFARVSRVNHATKMGARQRVLNSHKRMPRYMIQFYKELTTGDDGGLVKKTIPYQANAIRGINTEVTKLSEASMKINIKMGYFRDKDLVTRDELHLHMNPRDPLDKDIFKPFILTFHDIHTDKLIREFKIPAFNQGWQVLSLKRWTNTWVKSPSTNKGILLTIYRGRGRKLALQNPFINFPYGDDPYLILFASESVRSLLAWKFLIENALNSVAGTKKLSRDGKRVTRDMSQQSQCTAVETEVNLTDMMIDNHTIIIEPKVYKQANCSRSCIMQPPTGFSEERRPSHERYCCVPTRRRGLGVLMKDPNTETISFEILPRFSPTSCMWVKE